MNAGRIVIILLLLLAIAANTIPRWFDFGSIEGRKVYYVGQALSFILIILAGWIKREKDEVAEIFFQFTFLLAMNNLLDELFFDPVIFGLNEIIFATGAIIWTVYLLIKCLTRTRSS